MNQNQITLHRKWVCYGWSVNQKYIIWDAQEGSISESSLYRFLQTVEGNVNGYQVNLCELPAEIRINQLHQGALTLQENLNRSLVVGRSGIIENQKTVVPILFPKFSLRHSCSF